ncbi:hypothetical protein [Afifella sp. IM 167]|uniref:hypothetical protein n=1 Tax=Afifella sp. IM 167 TaxID=2033586 RepID=UPI001CCE2955|nr:hypothetical protein [Afifella sp. IM 167]
MISSSRFAAKLFIVALVTLVAPWSMVKPSQGQSTDRCAAIQRFTETGEPIPVAELGSSEEVVPCLLSQIRAHASFLLAKDEKEETLDAQRFRVITGALRNAISVSSRNAIRVLRAEDDVLDAEILARGARHHDRGIRINSAFILANVVDNSTACVVVDFAYLDVAASISDTPAINGRANLIKIASVVAPWAFRENFQALDQLHEKLTSEMKLYPADVLKNLSNTIDLLNLLRLRLDSQENIDNSPKNFPIPPSIGSGCRAEYRFRNEEIEKLYRSDAKGE